MNTKNSNFNISQFIETKILEFFGDPDNGLKLNKGFLKKMQERLGDKKVSHKTILKKYGSN